MMIIIIISLLHALLEKKKKKEKRFRLFKSVEDDFISKKTVLNSFALVKQYPNTIVFISSIILCSKISPLLLIVTVLEL